MVESIKNSLNEAQKEILINKNPARAIELLKNQKELHDFKVSETLAFAYFSQKEYAKAAKIYGLIGKYYQQGFCELLLGNYSNAKQIWFSADESPAISWARASLGFIKLKFEIIPSFLQIRGFLESDIHYFIQANQLDYADNLISCAGKFININLESYKYIGRALLNNNYKDLAFKFLSQNCEILPNDPEGYYYLALYHCEEQNFEKAERLLVKSLELSSTFTPAKTLLVKIKTLY